MRWGAVAIVVRMRKSLLSLTALALGMLFTPGARASILIEYTANGDPTLQGFLDRGGILSSTALTNDLGFNARSMSGNGCCGYYYAPFDFTTAYADGWSLGARMRQGSTSTGYGYLSINPTAGFKRFDLVLTFDGTNTNVGLFSDFGVTPVTSFAGNGYREYRFDYNPATGKADLFIDNVLASSGYAGFSSFLEGRGVMFGNVANTDGVTNFNYVRFTSGSPTQGGGEVPEPTAILLTAGGLVVVGLAKKRGR